ncbi:hypothetical protein O181_078924 [Austropuccinia psidii MF-1]|uniref:Intermembrane lipid transfer protein VPS13-like C-terminal domain-containing protein n=1 Tax=Austropuccinia psidii MF-1 TaxID=1389203 RepID=A0A9Q3FHV7_9BASI|nr:hypothetical protein [Austropuccinia psidii MF-1]
MSINSTNEKSDSQVLLAFIWAYLVSGDSVSAVTLLEQSLSPTIDQTSSNFKSDTNHILEIILGFIRLKDYASASKWIKRLFNGDHASYYLDNPSHRQEFMDQLVCLACEPGCGAAYDAAMISIDQIDSQFDTKASLLSAKKQVAHIKSTIEMIQDALENASSIVCYMIINWSLHSSRLWENGGRNLSKFKMLAKSSFVLALMRFAKFSETSWNPESINQRTMEPELIPEPDSEAGGLDLYFELLHLQPFVIVISFERQESVNVAECTFDSRNPLYFLLNAVTMAIGTISGAPLTLNQLKVENAQMSQGQLMTRLIQHYQNEGLSQLYRVIASADFLGNPAGLFNSQIGCWHCARRGESRQKSAFGVTDSVSKITGSVSKGLSAAALDSNWAGERQCRQFLNRNKVNGLVTGTSAFVGSLASGISGIAMKPIEGAVGFLKGLGKGLVGVVAKPAVGTFDFLSNVSGGLRNATTVFDPSHAGQPRLPRHIAHDGILKPYNIREAQGQDWLRSVENGKLHSCKYVDHVELLNDVDSVCILTTTHVVMIHTNKHKIVWLIETSELKGPLNQWASNSN